QSLAHAALDAALSIGTAALLGIAVWRLTGVYVWPEHLQFGFFGIQLLAGSLFTVLWMLPMFGAEALRRHVGLLEIVRVPRVLASFAIGLWIYGLVTGVCYTVRTPGRFREEAWRGAATGRAARRGQAGPT